MCASTGLHNGLLLLHVHVLIKRNPFLYKNLLSAPMTRLSLFLILSQTLTHTHLYSHAHTSKPNSDNDSALHHIITDFNHNFVTTHLLSKVSTCQDGPHGLPAEVAVTPLHSSHHTPPLPPSLPLFTLTYFHSTLNQIKTLFFMALRCHNCVTSVVDLLQTLEGRTACQSAPN